MKFAGSLALIANVACATTFSELGGFGGFGDDAGFSSGFDMESYFTDSDFTSSNKSSDKPESTSWTDKIGKSVVSENVKKGSDGSTITTQKVCKPGEEDSIHCRMIQVTNFGNGDADLLGNAGDNMENDGGVNTQGNQKAIFKNIETMQAQNEENTNLLSGLLANLGNITGLKKSSDSAEKAADGQAKIEEIAAKLNIVDNQIKATVSKSKEANPEKYGKDDETEVEDIVAKENKPIVVGSDAQQDTFRSLIAQARPEPTYAGRGYYG